LTLDKHGPPTKICLTLGSSAPSSPRFRDGDGAHRFRFSGSRGFSLAVTDLDALFHVLHGKYAGNVFTYDLTHKRGLIRRRPLPKKRTRPTTAQSTWRAVYRSAVYMWIQKTLDEKQKWKTAVNQKGVSGYDVFMSTALRRLRDGLPVPDDPPVGAGCKPPCPRPKKPKKPDPTPEPPPIPCTTHFLDDFDRIENPMNTNWVQHISAGQEWATRDVGIGYAYLRSKVTWDNQIVKAHYVENLCSDDADIGLASIWTDSVSANTVVRLFGRMADSTSNPDRYVFVMDFGGVTKLYKVVSGLYSLLATAGGGSSSLMTLKTSDASQLCSTAAGPVIFAEDNEISTGKYTGFRGMLMGALRSKELRVGSFLVGTPA